MTYNDTTSANATEHELKNQDGNPSVLGDVDLSEHNKRSAVAEEMTVAVKY